MNASTLLDRLDKVRQTGPEKWKASCPGPNHEHGDRHPSLSVRETPDGTILLKCFSGGCGAADIVDAIGLRLSDLFPESLTDHRRRPERRPFPAADILKALAHEALVVAIAAEDLRKGEKLSDEDHERLLQAVNRIQEGANYVR